jgi:hypothetical protein
MTVRICTFVAAIALAVPAGAQLDKIIAGLSGNGAPDASLAAAGLKEALRISTDHAIDLTSVTDGFFKNEAIKILLPDELRPLEKALRMAGQGPKIDDFVLSMNRAAEQATPSARAIFENAIAQMTFDDALKILMGGNTSATDYFEVKTTPQLAAAFLPVVDASMQKKGVGARLNQLVAFMGPAGNLGSGSLGNGGFGTGNLGSMQAGGTQKVAMTKYVLRKTLDGLFSILRKEETKIRTSPAARITPLLKRVFGRH